MSRYGILVNVDNCVGCQACFVACKQENQVAPGIQWNQIHRNENPVEKIINYYRVSCQHCDNPACLPVCPAKAIYVGPHGEVLVNQDKCIGCQACLQACPYGVPQFNTSGKTSYYDKPELVVIPLQPYQKRQPGKAERCTLCVHLTNESQIPACVRACAVGALNFVDWDNLDEKIKPMAEKSVAMNEAAGTKPKVRYYASHMDIAKLADKMTH